MGVRSWMCWVEGESESRFERNFVFGLDVCFL